MIDAHLKKNGNQQYLVGDKCTYADLAFAPWFWMISIPPYMMGEDFLKEWQEKYPQAWAWNERIAARPSVVKAKEARSAAMQKH